MVKPTEQFADLWNAAKKMDDDKDKADLLALFELADSLYLKVNCFGEAVDAVKKMIVSQNRNIRIMKKDNNKWRVLLKNSDKQNVIPER